jgi:MerR family transcriptional regulator, thiopeptide resistance regulator
VSATGYTIGRVAQLAGVSVRTLHHYDAIGLVHPSGRTAAGYRVYDGDDVARLQQVLIYRRLGFPLEEIPAVIDDPDVDAIGHLTRQRALLVDKRSELAAMITAIDAQITRRTEAQSMGMQLSPEEQLEIFGTDKVGGEWADEAAERWGETDAYQESQRRAAAYTKDDWVRLKNEADEGLAEFAEAMREGLAADSPQARDIAERHRQYLTRWFYDCSHEMHRGLADMYVSDARFTQLYEDIEPGLAGYVHDAICANADAR